MDIETCRTYCLSKKGTTEEQPFGPDALVYKVQGKMFALLGLDQYPLKISLKCNPEWALELRAIHDGKIIGAYHMNKKHWNSLEYEFLPPELTKELIDHSYDLVIQGLTRKQQQELNNL